MKKVRCNKADKCIISCPHKDLHFKDHTCHFECTLISDKSNQCVEVNTELVVVVLHQPCDDGKNSHSYVLGAFDSVDIAIAEGLKENYNRGNTYEIQYNVVGENGFVVERWFNNNRLTKEQKEQIKKNLKNKLIIK